MLKGKTIMRGVRVRQKYRVTDMSRGRNKRYVREKVMKDTKKNPELNPEQEYRGRTLALHSTNSGLIPGILNLQGVTPKYRVNNP